MFIPLLVSKDREVAGAVAVEPDPDINWLEKREPTPMRAKSEEPMKAFCPEAIVVTLLEVREEVPLLERTKSEPMEDADSKVFEPNIMSPNAVIFEDSSELMVVGPLEAMFKLDSELKE